jgi:hypothetical protein
MKRHIVTVKDPIVSAFFPAFLPKWIPQTP